MFNLADQTYRRIPARMPLEAAIATLDAVRRHAAGDARPSFDFVLHGGEPTLWPLAHFDTFLQRVEAARAEHMDITVSVQSNGYSIPDRLVSLFAEHHVSLGISLDGPREANDRYRISHSGTGSYQRVMGTVDRIISNGYRDVINGFLCVAQPDLPPRHFLDWADTLPVRRLDVLWPIEFHYKNLPWAEGELAAYNRNPRFGSWFAELFQEWWRRDDPTMHIRLFYDCISVLLGSKQHCDNLVNDMIDMFVVNTDGIVEYPDWFRAAKDGGSRTSFSIHEIELDALRQDPVFRYCLDLRAHLPTECVPCPHVDLCGGGFLPARMNPDERIPSRKSVLCSDHYYFFDALKQCVAPALEGSASERIRNQ
jgi:uncharacterized protein